MTMSTITNRVAYAGDGVSTAFAVPFPFYDAADLEVWERNTATGAETLKTLTTHYTVTGGLGLVGTVTATSAPSALVQWVILRATPLTQLTDFEEGDPFPAANMENQLDKAMRAVQDVNEKTGRAPTLSKGTPITTPLVLPPPGAGLAIGWNSAGTALETKAVIANPVTGLDMLSNYADFATMISTVGASERTVLVDVAGAVSVNTTIPETLHLWFLRSGALTVNGGVTLTLNGHVTAGAYQIFAGDGTVSFMGTGPRQIFVDWFPTVARAFASINAGAGTHKAEIRFTPGKTYVISGQVILDRPKYVRIVAFGALIQCDVTGDFAFNLNTGADGTSVGTIEATLGYHVEWFGGYVYPTPGKERINSFCKTFGFRRLTFEDIRVANCDKGILFGNRDSIVFNRCWFSQNKTAFELAQWHATGDPTIMISVVDTYISTSSACNYGAALLGDYAECRFVRTSFNGVTAETGAQLLAYVGYKANGSVLDFDDCHFEQAATTASAHYSPLKITRNPAEARTLYSLRIRGGKIQGVSANAGKIMKLLDVDNVQYVEIDGVRFAGGASSGGIVRPITLSACTNVHIGPLNTLNVTGNAVGTAQVMFDSGCSRVLINRHRAAAAYIADLNGMARKELTCTPDATKINITIVNGATAGTTASEVIALDMRTLLGTNFPALCPPRGYWLNVVANDSASSGAACSVQFAAAGDNTWNAADALLNLQGVPNGVNAGAGFFVPCNDDGDIQMRVVGSGDGTVTLTVVCAGYIM